MPPLTDTAFAPLAKTLTQYHLDSTVRQVAGLLTVPSLQRFALRLEVLTHLAVLHCRGNRVATPNDLASWLNDYLGATPVAPLEDPPEDVFVSNVRTDSGNRRLFEGLWESADYFTQQLVNVLSFNEAPSRWSYLADPIDALLALSDSVADELNLPRWHSAAETALDPVLPPSVQCNRHAKAIAFDEKRLAALDVDPQHLEPFILQGDDLTTMRSETLRHTSLERRPLFRTADGLTLVLPTAVSAALRRFVLARLKQDEDLPSFVQILSARQADQVGSLLRKGLPTSRNSSSWTRFPCRPVVLLFRLG